MLFRFSVYLRNLPPKIKQSLLKESSYTFDLITRKVSKVFDTMFRYEKSANIDCYTSYLKSLNFRGFLISRMPKNYYLKVFNFANRSKMKILCSYELKIMGFKKDILLE